MDLRTRLQRLDVGVARFLVALPGRIWSILPYSRRKYPIPDSSVVTRFAVASDTVRPGDMVEVDDIGNIHAVGRLMNLPVFRQDDPPEGFEPTALGPGFKRQVQYCDYPAQYDQGYSGSSIGWYNSSIR